MGQRKRVLLTPGRGRERGFFRITDPDAEWLGGVCAGLAYWIGCPTWIVRLVWFLVAWFYGAGLLVYLLLWLFVPAKDSVPPDYVRRTGG
ncbi:hypothetical protein AMJ57_02745 [Parcubacteria bacterium SG8_24]|nr:MAG: hypothetical protein AMJ57_02745 [Parcubacteria bacterium SG8_24]